MRSEHNIETMMERKSAKAKSEPKGKSSKVKRVAAKSAAIEIDAIPDRRPDRRRLDRCVLLNAVTKA